MKKCERERSVAVGEARGADGRNVMRPMMAAIGVCAVMASMALAGCSGKLEEDVSALQAENATLRKQAADLGARLATVQKDLDESRRALASVRDAAAGVRKAATDVNASLGAISQATSRGDLDLRLIGVQGSLYYLMNEADRLQEVTR